MTVGFRMQKKTGASQAFSSLTNKREVGMPQNNDELKKKINDFLDRKTSKYPDIRYYAKH